MKGSLSIVLWHLDYSLNDDGLIEVIVGKSILDSTDRKFMRKNKTEETNQNCLKIAQNSIKR